MMHDALPFDTEGLPLERARAIKLAIFDVDGVLTDGRLFVDNQGHEYKAFNSSDGHGMKMLRDSGVEIGIITGRRSGVVTHRCKELGIRHVHQGSDDKLATYRQLLKETGLSESQTAFVGDDVVDLPVLLQSGLAVAVQNAHPLVKKHAHWVTPSAGGEGAAREFCEMIMLAQGSYTAIMGRYIVV
jgi:3-deoxy-D-manno-octulosonate 8-phosphate phosphatase (KDO 8-P phosphatase)